MRPWGSIVKLLAVLVLLLPSLAGAEEPPSYRGSRLFYRNAVSALSFDESAEPTYDPTYVMTLGLQPRWYFTEWLYTRAGLTFSRELTESNWTTEEREVYLGDTSLAVGSPAIWAVPVLDTVFFGELGLRFPTSKAAQARTLQVSLEPTVGVRQAFTVLSGITLGYRFGFARDFHEFTTAERAAPLIGGCTTGAECARFLNTGERNTTWRLSHSVDLGVAFTRWLALGGAFGVYQQFLHPRTEIEGESLTTVDEVDTRYYVSYDLEATFRPFGALEIGLGTTTFNAQQKPDSTFRTPVFNRFTHVYLDLRFVPEGLFRESEG